jgi:hypothetical protein
MAQIDLHTRILGTPALNPQTISSDTTTNGVIIDTLGYQSIEFILQSGVITTGVFTPVIYESDDSGLSGATAMPTDYLLGTYALATFTTASADDNACKQVGCLPKKRYVRLSIVTTGSTANGIIGAVAVKGSPAIQGVDALT